MEKEKPYQPSEEEMQKAEDTMTDKQKESSRTREEEVQAESEIEQVRTRGKESQKAIAQQRKIINAAEKIIGSENKNLNDVSKNLWETVSEKYGTVGLLTGYDGAHDEQSTMEAFKKEGKAALNITKEMYGIYYYNRSQQELGSFGNYKYEKNLHKIIEDLEKKNRNFDYEKRQKSISDAETFFPLHQFLKSLEGKPKGIIRIQNTEFGKATRHIVESGFISEACQFLTQMGYVIEIEYDYFDDHGVLRNPLRGSIEDRKKAYPGRVLTEFGDFFVKESFEETKSNKVKDNIKK